MNRESTRVPNDSPGSLSNCLVEGDSAQNRSSRKIRRRAILLSILLQSIAIAALIIFPLLGKGERIPVRIFVERSPFPLGANQPNKRDTVRHQHPSTDPFIYRTEFVIRARAITPTDGNDVPSTPGEAPAIGDGSTGDPNGTRFGMDLPLASPPSPNNENLRHVEARRLQAGHLDPSRLIRRVEPIYPHLGVQLHRQTTVELRAIIATDGSIQSLQVLSGDPLFFQSAIDAVSRWQYSPTILNGQPVEIDTHITVIYSLHH
jgi:protein TonB